LSNKQSESLTNLIKDEPEAPKIDQAKSIEIENNRRIENEQNNRDRFISQIFYKDGYRTRITKLAQRLQFKKQIKFLGLEIDIENKDKFSH